MWTTLLIIALLCFVAFIVKKGITPNLPPRHPSVDFLPKGKVKKVAVIGAGSSGITAAKEAKEGGFEVTVFEQTGEIGGNWYYRDIENHSSVYKSTFINTSRQIMAYSDFPMPEDFPVFPHHKQIVKYFYDYAKHFGVMELIKFHTQVLKVEPQKDDKWKISYRYTKDGKPLYMTGTDSSQDINEEIFDAVILANGHHSVPRWPTPFEGQEKFKGHIMHSHQYKDPTTGYDFNDKKVVILGIGNSSVDITVELSRVARQVYLSTRSGTWVLPKYVAGVPLDFNRTNRFINNILREYPKIAVWAFRTIFESIVNKQQGEMKKWGLEPPAHVDQMHPTVSQELLSRIGNGTVKVKPGIKSFTENSVVFTDGTSVQADAVIFATGYKIVFDFLDPSLLPVGDDNQVSLYKYIFPPELPPTLSIIGLVQPLGAIMPIAEMQSRWIVQILLGNSGLPSKEEMKKDIEAKKERMKRVYLKSPRHTIQVDMDVYMDEIANQFGVVPDVMNHLDLWRELWFTPIVPPQYRLDGPGSKPEAAEQLKRVCRTIREETYHHEAGASWLDDEKKNQ